MSESSLEARIVYIQKMIFHIGIVIDRHQTVEAALEDEAEARAAIMMALLQIGENLQKIEREVLEKYDLLLDAKGAYSVRNFIAHDYEGVDLALIGELIKDNLSSLNERLEQMRSDISDG
jgi:uncharacterized protein with HEPN domain